MVTALVGAGIILGLGVASAEEVFYSHETGVDWESRQLLDDSGTGCTGCSRADAADADTAADGGAGDAGDVS